MARQAHVGRLLLTANRRFEEELTERLNARGYVDIRSAHSAVFAHLDPEGTRPTKLARRAGMTKQSMGELIADLEAKGYVERREDAGDRRARIVVLTDAGIRLDREAARAVAEIERDYRRRLGPEHFAALRGALDELSGNTGEPHTR